MLLESWGERVRRGCRPSLWLCGWSLLPCIIVAFIMSVSSKRKRDADTLPPDPDNYEDALTVARRLAKKFALDPELLQGLCPYLLSFGIWFADN
jgi:hypothetical protein